MLSSNRTSVLVIFSETTLIDLIKKIETTIVFVANYEVPLWLIAKRSQLTKHFINGFKLAICAETHSDLIDKLKIVLCHLKTNPNLEFSTLDIYFKKIATPNIKIAFLFPGQGSQYLNMGKDFISAFANIHPIANRITLINDLLFAISHEISKVEKTHPAIALLSAIYFDMVSSTGIKPDFIAGHSFGEIPALYAAGVLSFEDMMFAARKRGTIISRASPIVRGGMLAVAISAKIMVQLLEEWSILLSVAIHNSPKQVILSGPLKEIEFVKVKLKSIKISYRSVPAHAAFHTTAMTKYSMDFAAVLEQINFNLMRIPLYNNVRGELHLNNAESLRRLTAQQISHPVFFQKMIKSLYKKRVNVFVELGPGNVLARLVEECLPGEDVRILSVDKKGTHGVTQMWRCLARLFVMGLDLDFTVFFRPH